MGQQSVVHVKQYYDQPPQNQQQSKTESNTSRQSNPNPQAPRYEMVNENKPNRSNTYEKTVQMSRQTTNQIVKNYRGKITVSDLQVVFKKHAIEGRYLNKSRFDDCIEGLFLRFNVSRMHYTYLSTKIYEVLDASNDGKIQEEEFVNGMSNVLGDKEFRMKSKLLD